MQLSDYADIIGATKAITAQQTYSLPLDATFDVRKWPSSAVYYCAIRNYSVSKNAHSIAYAPQTRRLLLPVSDGHGRTVGAFGRLIGDYNVVSRLPRYIQMGSTRNIPVAPLVSNMLGDISTVVLTEDLLSAWNVSRVIDAGSVLGTVVNHTHISTLADYERVILWLDSDKYGQQGAARAVKLLELVGKDVIRVSSPLDPKYYSLSELLSIIGGVLGREIIKTNEVQEQLQRIAWLNRRRGCRTNNIQIIR